MERPQEGQDISVLDKQLEKGCRLKIVQNRTSSLFMPNNDYWKRSRMEIIEGALPGGPGY